MKTNDYISGIKYYLPVTLCFILIVSCATVPLTNRRQLNLIPSGELLNMSFQQYEQIKKESKLSNDPAKVGMVQNAGTRISRATENFLKENKISMKFAWEYIVIEDDKTVNAWCMPGGKIAFYTGILPVTQNENGVAVVMGHEVAHAVAQHGNERMSQMLLVQLGGIALAEAVKKEPKKTQMLYMAAFGLGAQLGVMLPYSRNHEKEADHIGLILMAKAGYDPNEAVSFWTRMTKKGGQQPPEFLCALGPPSRMDLLDIVARHDDQVGALQHDPSQDPPLIGADHVGLEVRHNGDLEFLVQLGRFDPDLSHLEPVGFDQERVGGDK